MKVLALCISVIQPLRGRLYFWRLFSDVSLANDQVLTILSQHSMSLWKLEVQVQPHYSVFLARRLHTSGWSISRVINKITLARFWQASVIAANELSTSQINQSWEKDLYFLHNSENSWIIQGICSHVGLRRSVMWHTYTGRCPLEIHSSITQTSKKLLSEEMPFVLICTWDATT